MWSCLPLYSVSPCQLSLRVDFGLCRGNSRGGYKATTGKPARRLKKWDLGKSHLWGKIPIGHETVCRRDGPYVRFLWPSHEYEGTLKMLDALMCLIEELSSAHCGSEVK